MPVRIWHGSTHLYVLIISAKRHRKRAVFEQGAMWLESRNPAFWPVQVNGLENGDGINARRKSMLVEVSIRTDTRFIQSTDCTNR